MKMWNFLIFMLSIVCASTFAQTWLRADGSSDAYTLIDSVLGINATETVPDCKHKEKHIVMANDDELKRPVFLMHLHVDLDDDYCKTAVRQRTEITVTDAAPNDIKGLNNDAVSLSWNFRLGANFQASEAFTTIHQLNIRKNGVGFPLVVIIVNKGDPDMLRIAYFHSNMTIALLADSNMTIALLAETPVAPFKGTWVHVQESATYSNTGKYSITMTKLSDSSNLFKVSETNLEMWRDGAAFIRPKWGIYRNLSIKAQLRDEIVKFDSFCIGKGSNICQ